MPEQKSERDLAVTRSNFESPFETTIYPYGMGGLNLKDQLDQIPVGMFAILTNLTHTMDRGLTARPGVASLATGGTNHHTVRRLHDPEAGFDTRFWGIDQQLYRGLSGALTSIDSGYSGNPLYLLPHRPPLSGDPWMFVADSARMRKVRADGLVTPIGLPIPSSSPSVIASAAYRKKVAAFDTSDGTQSALWQTFQGYPPYLFAPGTLNTVPWLSDIPGPDGQAVQLYALYNFAPYSTPDNPKPGFTVAPGYVVGMAIQKRMDLTAFDGIDRAGFPPGAPPPPNPPPISDQDIFHIQLFVSAPSVISEIRIYFVCSPFIPPRPPTSTPPSSPIASSALAAVSDWSLPGMGNGYFSPSAYMLTIRPSDYTNALLAQESIQSAADRVRTAAFLETYVDPVSAKAASQPSYENLAGANVWSEFGKLHVPIIRRGDFVKIGSAGIGPTGAPDSTDWSNITGMYISIHQSVSLTKLELRAGFDNCYFTGGFNPDTSGAGQPYDYRITNYDPRTGAEGNPSVVQTTGTDALRQQMTITPPPYGDSAIVQRFYRRGGTLIGNWYYLGANTGDGVAFVDNTADDTAVTAGTVNLDHFQPVPTVDVAGNTVLAQPVPVIFGPAGGMLFALGDPLRPGHLYWCIPDQPDHWPAENNFEVCSPSEELMAGLMHAAQPFCFSRERLYAIYPNLTNTSSVTVTTTECRRGLVSRWGWALGYGFIFGVGHDAVFATRGGVEEIVSLDIQPLFRGQVWNGYQPIDFGFPTAIRLAVYQDELYFLYQAVDGNRYVLVYSLLFKYWKSFQFGQQLSAISDDTDSPIDALLIGGLTNGTTGTLSLSAFSDLGVPITCTARTGNWNLERPREDKLLGDQILDVDTQGVALTLTNRLNDGGVANTPIAVTSAAGRSRVILDSFGTVPQRARNISTEVGWSSSSARPTLYFLGQSVILEPDQTVNRMTQWSDLGDPDESYVTGVTFDCDTGGQDRSILVERDFLGQISTMATLTVNANGRRKLKFSWADPATGHGFQANKVRIRPSDVCQIWILYKADWIALGEPPRIARWDIHFEAEGDAYYTGLDLYCDTGGQQKQIVVEVDGVILHNPYTNENLWRVTAIGRQWVHLTLPWGRGHVFHFHAIDTNPGLLYKHKWFVAEEPSEQYNWNQNFSPEGTFADKWFKAFLFEVDTFGQNKTVEVQLDGVTVETFTVNTNGRLVVQHALTDRRMGRVLRVFPTDGYPSRPYEIRPIFDEEPYQLDRWQTEETDHGLMGFQVPIDAQITLRSTNEVRLTLYVYVNQNGTILSDLYIIPTTDGVKDKRYLPFVARKGVLFRYVFESNSAFHLYEEESYVRIQPWGAPDVITVHPFGNDDVDESRKMVIPALAAARSGGGSR